MDTRNSLSSGGPLSSPSDAGIPWLARAGRSLSGAIAWLLAGGAALAGALAADPATRPWSAPAAGALALYCGLALLVLRGFARQGGGVFGAANAITTLRAAAVAFLAGLALLDPVRLAACRGCAAGLGLSCLLLDGADGWVARRRGLASRFGARFDMETDALTVLVLAVLIARAGIAGFWVLALGLMRYGFVATALLWPPLGRALPESGRRRAICAAVVAALVAALAPAGTPALDRLLCAGALALLVYSFAVDYLWLWWMWRILPAADGAMPDQILPRRHAGSSHAG